LAKASDFYLKGDVYNSVIAYETAVNVAKKMILFTLAEAPL
jgi:hypothetical protein